MKTLKTISKLDKHPKAFLAADLIVILLVLLLGYGFVRFVDLSSMPFIAEAPVEVSLRTLPVYALLSLTRSLIALALSYVFAIVYGTIAASRPSFERVMIPILDVLQSLPVVSFMPGFVLVLTQIFPESRWGLEIACILLIFTGQVWNLVFAYYESQTTMPSELKDVTTIVRMSWVQRFLILDLPNGVRPLVYNGMMAMAGGWFFLTLCEAFTLGQRDFRLPGLGSFLRVAFDTGNYPAFAAGVFCIVLLIVGVDFFLWRPLIAWSGRFREAKDSADQEEKSVFLNLLDRTRLTRWVSGQVERLVDKFKPDSVSVTSDAKSEKSTSTEWLARRLAVSNGRMAQMNRWTPTVTMWVLTFGAGGLVFAALPEIPGLALTLTEISDRDWLRLINSLFLTFIRIVVVLAISTAWAVPVGLWIGINPRVARIAQPIVQNIAAFPAPVLFPLIGMNLYHIGVPVEVIAIVLMLIGNQWYIFFNVISGASRISGELRMVSKLYRLSLYEKWIKLYLPSIFPGLVTGWITAAGGSWNTSIVAERIIIPGGEIRTPGIGLELTLATEDGSSLRLVAAISVITIALIVLNRSVWRSLHLSAEKLKEGTVQ